MPGSLKRGSDGSLLRNGDGDLIHDCGGSACSECTHCASCSGGDEAGCPDETCCTPSYWKVVISGVNIVSDCFNCGASSMDTGVDPGINSTFTLPQISTCAWSQTIGTGGVDHDQNNTDCSATNTVSASIVLTLNRSSSTNYTLTASGGGITFFEDFVASAVANRCDQQVDFVNRTTYQCDAFPDSDVWPGKDGTATATPCDL